MNKDLKLNPSKPGIIGLIVFIFSPLWYYIYGFEFNVIKLSVLRLASMASLIGLVVVIRFKIIITNNYIIKYDTLSKNKIEIYLNNSAKWHEVKLVFGHGMCINNDYHQICISSFFSNYADAKDRVRVLTENGNPG